MTPTKSAMEIEDGHFTKQTPAPCQRMHAAGLYGSSGHLQTSTKGLHANQVLFKWRVAASRNSHQRSVSAFMLPGSTAVAATFKPRPRDYIQIMCFGDGKWPLHGTTTSDVSALVCCRAPWQK